MAMIGNTRGYAALIVCILLPVVLLGLGMISFSLLKTRHSHQIKTACQTQYHSYFAPIRSQIYIIESIAPMAVTLYQMQMALLPIIWHPAALRAYNYILKLRRKMDHIQERMISMFNKINSLRSMVTLAQVQKTLFSENKKLKSTLAHASDLRFNVDPKMQIVKKLSILFPPYQRHPQIEKKQEFSVSIQHKIKPLSWMTFFRIQKLNQNYTCSATLKSDSHNKLFINYRI
jgi:hypothetical protein